MSSLDHRRIAIVGSGIAGLSLAYRLVERGLKPLVIGSNFRPHNASRCAQGVLSNKGLIFFESPLFAAKLRSLNHVKTWLSEIEEKSQYPIPRRFSGIFEPYWDAEDFRALASRIYRRQYWGCYLTQNKGESQWPSLPFSKKKPHGFLYYPRDGWFDVEAALEALLRIIKSKGTDFLEDDVLSFSAHGTDEIKLTFGQGQPRFVDTLILASGAGTPDLLKNSGIKVPKNFIIGGQTLEINLPFVSHEILTFVRGTFSATWSGAKLVIGSSSWKGSDISKDSLKKDVDLLMSEANLRFGWDLNSTELSLLSRMGARFRFADRMPAVGSYGEEPWKKNLYFLTGFYKNGLQLADLCSLDLLKILEGNESQVCYPEFSPSRFNKSRC